MSSEFDKLYQDPPKPDAAAIPILDGGSIGSIFHFARKLPAIREMFLGITAHDPPDDEDDYENANYWILRTIPLRSNEVTDQLELEPAPLRAAGQVLQHVTATNLAELFPQISDKAGGGDGSHSIPKRTPVLVWGIADSSNPLKVNYFFNLAAQLIVRPKSNASGSGWYAGKIMIPATTASDPATAFTATQMGSEGADCFIANLWEEGRSGHALGFSAFIPLEFPVIAVLPAKADGTPCFLIMGRQDDACT